MAALTDDFQFELDGYVFGRGCPVFVDRDGFDTGTVEPNTQDGVNPLTGARIFGRDTDGAETWQWACFLDTENEADALAAVAAMGAKWRDPKWKVTGAVAEMRYRIAGRTRSVFGRPRRFSFKPGGDIIFGNLPPLATFDKVDAKHYDTTDLFLDLQFVPQVEGGFEVPFTTPLTITRDPAAGVPGAVTIGGDAPTSAVVTFTGPVTNPSVTIGSFFFGVVGTIPAGASVTLDSRPWARSMTKTGPVGDISLARGTYLSRAVLTPGNYAAVFRGIDTTGGARCRVAWRNAYHTL